MKSFLFLTALSCTLVFTACNFNTNDVLDPPQYDITVTVLDDLGNPIPEANVFLFESSEEYRSHLENNPNADPLLEPSLVKAFGTSNDQGIVLFPGLIFPGTVSNREAYYPSGFFIRGHKVIIEDQESIVLDNNPEPIQRLFENEFRLESVIGDGKKLEKQVEIELKGE